MKLYFRVTKDEYELPIGVCTWSNIEKVHGKNPLSVSSMISKKCRWRKVEVNEEDDEE